MVNGVAWIPGQSVDIDYAAIVEILIAQFDSQRKTLPLRHSTLLNPFVQMMKFNDRLHYGGLRSF